MLGSLLLSLSLGTPALGASVAANQAALQAQILTLANLPQAWTITSGSANGGGVAAGCGGRPFGASHRIAEAEASFEDPADLPQLFEQIAVLLHIIEMRGYARPGERGRRAQPGAERGQAARIGGDQQDRAVPSGTRLT